ncbi:DUF2269 family protein [Bordetella bronchialis]|uniref:DUF2269 domain-containing protein n=1 Tax=Bordetella bronchialis TaxID=463025 RepID=A0A193FIL6_9BORD|nr:DUF2269 domain-containing protein [Bordetella bronchialis]ANN67073.1 hypothetical protein BAU06_12920 [Bordetella bronchialis]ANN72150.1 hypothetical protein BAU08_13115 [Bordetella bronchialis]
MDIVIVKWIHILSSTLLFGTGIGSAFYLLAATLHGDARVVAPVARFVVRADWMFTATTAVIQPASGAWLAWRYGLGMEATWIRVSVILYVVAIACWLPVVWLQVRLRDTAMAALGDGAAAPVRLPPAYRRYFRIWFLLGIPAFVAFLAIFYLMVAKTP